jgi:hypothetical protein
MLKPAMGDIGWLNLIILSAGLMGWKILQRNTFQTGGMTMNRQRS